MWIQEGSLPEEVTWLYNFAMTQLKVYPRHGELEIGLGETFVFSAGFIHWMSMQSISSVCQAPSLKPEIMETGFVTLRDARRGKFSVTQLPSCQH